MFDFLHKKAQDATPPALPEGTVRRRYSIEGQVQGVGFRYRARYAAQALELTGWVKNAENGEVIAEVQGFESRIRFLLKFMNSLKRIKIRKMENKPHSIREDETTFKIL